MDFCLRFPRFEAELRFTVVRIARTFLQFGLNQFARSLPIVHTQGQLLTFSCDGIEHRWVDVIIQATVRQLGKLQTLHRRF